MPASTSWRIARSTASTERRSRRANVERDGIRDPVLLPYRNSSEYSRNGASGIAESMTHSGTRANRGSSTTRVPFWESEDEDGSGASAVIS
jgi:hypothetical protein